jgi:esterase/lipase superfamily enzyme
VFIHGFNVSFENAARRTAQLAFDLGIDGPAAFFSWPSRGSIRAYTADEAAVDRSVPFLERFMQNFVMRADPGRLNVIAHSMGSRAFTSVLRNLHGGRSSPAISNVILAAPDIDAEVFEQQIAPAIASAARRITLYASSDDRALQASARIHSYRRAGESGDSIIVAPGIETIDASGINTDLLGHGYFAQNKAVLDDLYMLFKHDLPAKSRNLRERRKGESAFWAFTPR